MTSDDAATPAGGRRTARGRTMEPDRWRQVKALLERALDLDPPARAAFVLAESGDDADLRGEVESLLQALEREGERFEQPAVVRMRRLPEAGEPAGVAGRPSAPPCSSRTATWSCTATSSRATSWSPRTAR